VVRDEEYMARTWEVTPVWNAYLRQQLASRFPTWKASAGRGCVSVTVVPCSEPPSLRVRKLNGAWSSSG
jgi:hypothetical protein